MVYFDGPIKLKENHLFQSKFNLRVRAGGLWVKQQE
jgi:hypothetical protein